MRFAPGAWRYAGLAFLVALPTLFVSVLASLLFAAGGVFTLWFFRDPDRHPPSSGLLAPADGRVTVIRREGDRLRVGVFMNVMDVHVNRSPVTGVVTDVDHAPGRHLPAFTKESDRNEHVTVSLNRTDADSGSGELEVILIAGAFARRITPYVEPGDELERGDRISHIAFGSRADVVLPPEVDPATLAITRGDRVRAGETVLVSDPPK